MSPQDKIDPASKAVAREEQQAAKNADEIDNQESDDDDFEPDHATASLNQRTRDTAQFSEWMRAEKHKAYNAESDETTDGDKKSTAWLVRRAGSEKIIESPREYQVELFERAKEKNIIAVLDTGTGKTLIAALLLQHTIAQELEDRKSGKPKRLSFFLVDKVALVFQQYEVLKANLNQPIERFYGDFHSSTLTHELWQAHCDKTMIIVCTAAILYQCLHHSFVRMDQINLLIFDEAHHAKKNHPYARIIKDFYATLEKKDQLRPRIMGMTASPVDAKTDVRTAAAQLEGLLHSEIATVADPTVFKRSSINRAENVNVEYGCFASPFETILWKKLYNLVGQNEEFSKLFTYSRHCTTELGRWCADRIWQLCLTYDESLKIAARAERNFTHSQIIQPIKVLDAERSAVQAAYNTVRDHRFQEPQNGPFYISEKVSSLIKALREHFDPKHDKCIVFVEQRLTVRLLVDLFSQPSLGIVGIRPGSLIGTATSETGDLGMSLKAQVLSMHRFRQGDINCIFATSVGEEGIDIPDCNIIIRFDPCKTMIQYIQSRGRARRANSKFIHMTSHSHYDHQQSVREHQENEAKLREFCRALPKDRQIGGSDYGIEYFLAKEMTRRTYTVPSTQAKLTYGISLTVLANFVSTLPHPPDVNLAADYMVRHVGKEFICEVLLPDSSPIKSVVGKPATTKQVAKCSAAFDMCLRLRKQKLLDDHLQSTFTKRLPLMRNARLAISSKRRAEYPMRVKPDIWSHHGIPKKLYVTVLGLINPEALERPSKPMAMLSRLPLPRIATFTLFFGNKRASNVRYVPLSQAIDTSPEVVEQLDHFTLRAFKDVFSKEYKSEPDKMPYFLAPVRRPHNFDFTKAGSPRDIVDWDCLSQLLNTPEYVDSENQPDEVFNDKYVVDPHDGSRKFYTVCPRPDLTPADPEPHGVAKGQQSRKAKQQGLAELDVWNFSISIWSRGRAMLTVQHDLPVVEAEYIPLRRNLLDEFDPPEKVERRCYIIFQTLKLSALPVDFVAMVYNLPAITYRLESNLIVQETCKSLGLGIRPDLALEAMTKDSDNTEEHSEEQINVQRGMGKNYERLEFLGDSFLKMSTTISLYAQVPDSDEFQHHVNRMVLICNQNLFNNALDLKLEESIRSKGFNRRLWYPDGLELLKGKQNTSILGKKGSGRGVHTLADKSIADVCEALIGASYMTTYEQKNFDMAIQAVTKFVNHDHHRMMTWGDYYKAYEIPQWQSAESTAVQLDLARQIEEQLGYKFRYPRLLRSAFIHPSYGTIYERLPNYQRLEFLGDALLDMVCVDFLYHRFPAADPQWLTEHKMAMVSNQFLGCLCVGLGLQRHMLSMTGGLQREITEYVVSITDAREQAERVAEEAGLGRAAYSRDYWMREKRPPKCLPDLVESYVGAVFVDSAFDYGEVRSFFDRHVRPYFEDMRLYDTFANKHPIAFLGSLLQLHFRCVEWSLMVEEMDDIDATVGEVKVCCGVLIHGRVREGAVAASGRYAKMAAAEKMVATLNEMSLDEFRRRFGCTCNPDDVGVMAGDPLEHATAI